jgi:hypothetical protein
MVDKHEALSIFIKQNYRLMLATDFPERVFKQNKREYFLKNRVEVPKDSEIAKETLNYLVRINHIKNNDELEKVLQTPFFSDKISDRQYYVQKLKTMNEIPDLDLSLIKNEDYKTRIKGQIREQVRVL